MENMNSEYDSMARGACEFYLDNEELIHSNDARISTETLENKKGCSMPLSKSKKSFSLLSDKDLLNLLTQNGEWCYSNECVYPYNNLTCLSALYLALLLKNDSSEWTKWQSFNSCDPDRECENNNSSLNNCNLNSIEMKCPIANHNNSDHNKHNNLTIVDLAYNNIHLRGAIALFDALRNNNSLEYLNLSGNVLNEESETGKHAELENMIEMEKKTNIFSSIKLWQDSVQIGLDLHHCFNESLKEMFLHNNTLTHLYLNNTSLGVTELISLFHGLKNNISLRVLHLARPTFMSAECLKYVVSHLNNALMERTQFIATTKFSIDCDESKSIGLVELNLSFFGIENDHLQNLLPGIQMTRSLETLLLRGNRLSGEDGGKLLGELLTSHTVALKSLDVGANNIKEIGATYLANGISARANLEIIRFDHNRITQKGMMSLVTALGSCASICEINLWGNDALTEQCVIDTLGKTYDAMQWEKKVKLDFGLCKVDDDHYTIYKV